MPEKVILYAEDDPNDVVILKRALYRVGLPHSFYTVPDGQAVIDWLSGNSEWADRHTYPLPNVLILDLKMPKKTGFEVLEWVRRQPQFRTLSILVLSSSDEPEDIKRARKLGATAYFVKSPSNRELIEFLKS